MKIAKNVCFVECTNSFLLFGSSEKSKYVMIYFE